MKRTLSAIFALAALALCAEEQKKLPDALAAEESIVCFWDFSEPRGADRVSAGKTAFRLRESAGGIAHSEDGPFGGSAVFDGKANFLHMPNSEVGELNLTGEVTMVAWIKWEGKPCSFVAGLWNEYSDGGKRQYGLFASLPMYNGADQVCGHISKSGGPTPPFPFSIDYSASGQKIPKGVWTCIAMTYDGRFIKSYVNGEFAERPAEQIAHTKGFPGYPDGARHSKNPYYYPHGMGDNGSDFTVGAVMLKGGMGNFFKGKIAGVAVFKKALDESALRRICKAGK